MNFSLPKSLEVLERTPTIVSAYLDGLSEEWLLSNEGENTWSPKQVLAHLIVVEKTNWIVRAKTILLPGEKVFLPIDMSAHFVLAKNKTIQELLKEFSEVRKNAIKELKALNPDENDFIKTATHPKLGEVTLQQLLSAWVTHDLAHIAQISRVMAKQNKENVGPFITFLPILN